MCAEPATHKVGEEIPSDDPELMRHNYTAYVCCKHFRLIFGSAVPCANHVTLVKESALCVGKVDTPCAVLSDAHDDSGYGA